MTTTPQEALRQAKDAIEKVLRGWNFTILRDAVTVIDAALSQQAAQEPQPTCFIRGSGLEMLKQGQPAAVFPSEGCSNHSSPLYAAAPAEQEKYCTCHPDDNPPSPCAKQYAFSECKAAQEPGRWSIHFEDERDFCRFASLLIGAAYLSADNALERFQAGSLYGERTFGKVSATSSLYAAALAHKGAQGDKP